MSLPWIFVCPASRGIGFALTRHLLTHTPASIPVLATTRHPNPSTTKAAILEHLPQDPSRLHVVRCDVTDESSVAAAAQEAERLHPVDGHHLHLAAAIPGVLLNPEKSTAQIDATQALESFRVNAVGPLLLAKHFADFLPRKSTPLEGCGPLPPHATWVNMAARVGSTEENLSGGWFSYRASKAAVTSLTRSLDVLLRARAGDKALAVAYHPGSVRTELSRDFWGSVPPEKLFEPDYAAERMVDVVSGIKPEQRGRCWAWNGEEVPP